MEFKDIREKLKFILVPDACIEDTIRGFYFPEALRYKYIVNGVTYDYQGNRSVNVEYLLSHPDLLDLIVNTFEKNVVNPEKYKQKPTDMAETTTKKATVTKKSTFDKMKDKFKSIYLPEAETNMYMTFDGVICTKIGDEYVGFNKDNQLVSYPEEMKMDIPMYSMLKPISQIREGDIIKANHAFYKVSSTKKATEGQISVISFNGTKHYLKEIKDFLINQSFFRVVISFMDMNIFGNQKPTGEQTKQAPSTGMFGDVNPNMIMMMYMQDKDKSSGPSDVIKTMMMAQMIQQNNTGATTNMFGDMNPNMIMMMYMQDKDKGSDSNDIIKMMMMSQIIQQNNK